MATSAQDRINADATAEYTEKRLNSPDGARLVTLEDFSDGLILRLFISMDFLPSVVAFRQTSKRHHRISLERALWEQLLLKLIQAWPERCITLEQPMHSYSALEMEELVEKQVRLERIWTGNNATPVRREEISHPSKKARVPLLELIPGGRWLIQNDEEGLGRLLYCDLDAPDRDLRTLLEHGRSGDPVAINIAIDKHADGLELDIAVVFSQKGMCHASLCKSDDDQAGAKVLTIWRVTRNNVTNGLDATLSKEFPVYGLQRPVRSISLFGNLICRASWGPISGENLTRDLDMPKIHTYGWKSGDGPIDINTPPKEGFIIPLSELLVEGGVLLLPDGRVLAINESWVELHAPIELREPGEPTAEGEKAQSTPLWRYDFYPAMLHSRVGVSKLFVAPAKGTEAARVRCAMWNSSTVYLLSCKADGLSIPEVAEVMVGGEDSQDEFILRQRRGIRIHHSTNKEGSSYSACTIYQPETENGWRRLVGLPYHKPKVATAWTVKHTPLQVPDPGLQVLAFDEDSCRIVGSLKSEGRDKLVVLYFV
ncbi:hypothetical protein FS837_007823 [Tulasnella sp. UAMH 9824]|nr:hypothetical protein FS837_007823 [Tulasnella sp. UAMH 9824]